MNEPDLLRIEKALQISLPSEYRKFMLERSTELESYREEFCGESRSIFSDWLYLDPDEIIRVNLSDRDSHSDVADIFPNWWRTFFMYGTNGAGDYFCQRLDGVPGTWMIGSDCGVEPSLLDATLEEEVEERLEYFRRGEDYLEGRPLTIPEPFLRQTAAITPLEQALLERWKPEGGDGMYFAEFQIGHMAIVITRPAEPPSPEILAYIAEQRANIAENPYHLMRSVWEARIESQINPPKPPKYEYEVLSVNAEDNSMTLRHKGADNHGGDWRMQFNPTRDGLTWSKRLSEN
jgi:SMI1 / KNR4 family (SUKH-1)